jgi:hypothetical protein
MKMEIGMNCNLHVDMQNRHDCIAEYATHTHTHTHTHTQKADIYGD